MSNNHDEIKTFLLINQALQDANTRWEIPELMLDEKSFKEFIPRKLNSRVKNYHKIYLTCIKKLDENYEKLWDELEMLYINDIDKFNRLGERLIKSIEYCFHVIGKDDLELYKNEIMTEWPGDDGKMSAWDSTLKQVKNYIKTGQNPLHPMAANFFFMHSLNYFHENVLAFLHDLNPDLLNYSLLYKEPTAIMHRLSSNEPAQANEDPEKLAEKHLVWLSGEIGGQRIMMREDYDLLLKDTIDLIKTRKLSKSLKPKAVHLPIVFIRRNFFELAVEAGRYGDRLLWVWFLHASFTSFKCTVMTTRKHFSDDYKSYNHYKNRIKL